MYLNRHTSPGQCTQTQSRIADRGGLTSRPPPPLVCSARLADPPRTGPTPAADAAKVLDHLDEQMTAFVEQSPFLQLGTADSDGLPFVSPKGDHDGFVRLRPHSPPPAPPSLRTHIHARARTHTSSTFEAPRPRHAAGSVSDTLSSEPLTHEAQQRI